MNVVKCKSHHIPQPIPKYCPFGIGITDEESHTLIMATEKDRQMLNGEIKKHAAVNECNFESTDQQFELIDYHF